MFENGKQAPAGFKDGQLLELGKYGEAVSARLAAMREADFGSRLWRKDPGLWTGDAAQVKDSLGWLDVVETMTANLDVLSLLRDEVRAAGFQRVVHMGMGGSSLAPLVMGQVLPADGGLPLEILDTTDPATVLAIRAGGPLEDTLFIVASKSGTTAEPLAFETYFFHEMEQIKGGNAGDNFIAVTDPGSPLARSAEDRGFRHIFLNFPDIGGRYSALSFFGLVPAVLAGADVAALLDEAAAMRDACGAAVPVPENPALILGAVLGELGNRGRDKITFLAGKQIAPLALWLEQLLAESTGKEGKGLLPVAGEELGPPEAYGSDRLFVHLKPAHEDSLDAGVRGLREAGHPVVTIELDGDYALGREFFRWETATAAAGAVLGINPFDQPNVQESKDNTNRLLAEVKETGELPGEAPLLNHGPLAIYHESFEPPVTSVTAAISAFLRQANPGDYVALMAYLTADDVNDAALERLRRVVGRRLRLATTLGYGPRFLHSTGQLHKGGPNSGVFLQLTCDDSRDAQIPGAGYGFSIFKQAQALGDLEALRRHGRRVMRVHLGSDAGKGLARLEEIIQRAELEL